MCFGGGTKNAGKLATMALERRTAAVVMLQIASHRVPQMPHVKTNLFTTSLLATSKAVGRAPAPKERTEDLPFGAALAAEQISINFHRGGAALQAAAASKTRTQIQKQDVRKAWGWSPTAEDLFQFKAESFCQTGLKVVLQPHNMDD
jgi:hypothetical protein